MRTNQYHNQYATPRSSLQVGDYMMSEGKILRVIRLWPSVHRAELLNEATHERVFTRYH